MNALAPLGTPAERATAALHEAGYPDSWADESGVWAGGLVMPPTEIVHRALVIAGYPDVACRACFIHNTGRMDGDPSAARCAALGARLDDCGVER